MLLKSTTHVLDSAGGNLLYIFNNYCNNFFLSPCILTEAITLLEAWSCFLSILISLARLQTLE